MKEVKQEAIIILGMHRSGTSALGGMMQGLGIDFGNKLMPAMKDINDKGFYEHLDLVELHEKLLEVLGYRWLDIRPMPDLWWKTPETSHYKKLLSNVIQRDFDENRLWGMKDPRVCRLLPLWLDLLSESEVEPLFVLCIRHPDEVVESLKRRDGLEAEGVYYLWLWHVLEAEKLTRNHKRAVIFYSDLLENWEQVANDIANDLGIGWPLSIEQARHNLSGFIDQNLRHCRTKEAPSETEAARLSHLLYERLTKNKIEGFDDIRTCFEQEIKRSQGKLEFINQIQNLNQSNKSLTRSIQAEKENAEQQIEYREFLLTELRQQIADEQENAKQRIADEQENAKQQIEYRELLLADLRQKLADEKENAKQQIEYRDLMISELQHQLTELNLQLSEMNHKLTLQDEILMSRKLMLKRIIKLKKYY